MSASRARLYIEKQAYDRNTQQAQVAAARERQRKKGRLSVDRKGRRERRFATLERGKRRYGRKVSHQYEAIYREAAL